MFYWGYAAAKAGASSFKTGILETATQHLMSICQKGSLRDDGKGDGRRRHQGILTVVKRTPLVALTLVFFAVADSSARAESSGQYSHCVASAEQQSGYYDAAPSPTQNAPLRGAAAGAAGGAFIGGITGGSAGTGAAIGAAFGAIAGEVRRRESTSSRQKAENNFYAAYNACMNGQSH
jgi:YMGG-like Gly-zipper